MVDQAVLEARLRAGDEGAFVEAVQAWTPAMTRIATGFAIDPVVADEVVHESWLSVVARLSVGQVGPERPVGRLRTVVFESVVERARAAARERGSAHVLATEDMGAGPTVDPARFRPLSGTDPGGWQEFPAPWPDDADVGPALLAALRGLTGLQQAVVTLRDDEGCTAEEVCRMLDLTPDEQRAILHRGRATLRQAVEDHLHRQASA